jgi:hypothetical protein
MITEKNAFQGYEKGEQKGETTGETAKDLLPCC